MKKSDLFPSRFLKAEDLADDTVFTIREVKYEKLDDPKSGEKKEKGVVYFVESKKGLVLNVTNFDAIAEVAADDETENWSGVCVELYATRTQLGSKTVPCIRVRAPEKPKKTAAKPAAAAADAGMDDEIPF